MAKELEDQPLDEEVAQINRFLANQLEDSEPVNMDIDKFVLLEELPFCIN